MPATSAVLVQPLTATEIRSAHAATGRVAGQIRIPLNDLLENDFEWFLDKASCLLTGSPLLEDMTYRLVGADNGDAIFDIDGDPHEVLDAIDNE